MQRWLAFRQTCCVVFRPCWMLLPGQSPISTLGTHYHVARRTTLALCGWAHQVQAGDVDVVDTAQPPATCPLNLLVSLTFLLVEVFVHPPPTHYLSIRLGSSWSWSGISGCGFQTLERTSRRRHRFPCSLWRLSVVCLKLFVSFIVSVFIICTDRHLCNCGLYINIYIISIYKLINITHQRLKRQRDCVLVRMNEIWNTFLI